MTNYWYVFSGRRREDNDSETRRRDGRRNETGADSATNQNNVGGRYKWRCVMVVTAARERTSKQIRRNVLRHGRADMAAA